jgi:hypothetical protein
LRLPGTLECGQSQERIVVFFQRQQGYERRPVAKPAGRIADARRLRLLDSRKCLLDRRLNFSDALRFTSERTIITRIGDLLAGR